MHVTSKHSRSPLARSLKQPHSPQITMCGGGLVVDVFVATTLVRHRLTGGWATSLHIFGPLYNLGKYTQGPFRGMANVRNWQYYCVTSDRSAAVASAATHCIVCRINRRRGGRCCSSKHVYYSKTCIGVYTLHRSIKAVNRFSLSPR